MIPAIVRIMGPVTCCMGLIQDAYAQTNNRNMVHAKIVSARRLAGNDTASSSYELMTGNILVLKVIAGEDDDDTSL